ncbi:type III pantothenate kinase [Pseudoduganella sp. GCM10020061]|uniref:type III pantothenate kinase n=1 Tax=Pseudoduganella sp. GCM10020061 TaxID=3317345 RepID=UPI003638E7B9
MLLLVDCGNTRVKWALANDMAALGAWSDSGVAGHDHIGSLGERWRGLEIRRAIVANVAGPVLEGELRAVLPRDTTWFRSQAELKGMHNRYRNPQQLGADRFAAALGARALEPGKRIVVATCGTATTIDAVDAQGDFLGGMIVPGVGLMAASLARNTAQLPMVQPGTLPAGFADNTDDAILSGILSAQAGAIERACALHRAQLCIVSGGAAPYIAPALAVPHRMVDNIVLVGLHAAAT